MLKIAVTALAAATLVVAAQAAGVKDKEIVVGTHLDLSGPVAAGMPQLRNGMQMRLDEANDKGGVNGRKFKFVVEDNAQPAAGRRACDRKAGQQRRGIRDPQSVRLGHQRRCRSSARLMPA